MFDYFKKTILEFPNQINETLEAFQGVEVKGNFKNVAIIGQGASSSMADFIKNYFDIPVTFPRDYVLPRSVDKNTLIILSSSSGATEEVFFNLDDIVKKDFKNRCIAIGFGGPLKDYCEEIGIPYAGFEKPHDKMQARWSYGYSFTMMAMIIANSFGRPETKNELQETANKLNPESLEKEAEKITDVLKDKRPIIHGPMHMRELGRLWQIEIGEDTKRPAFSNRYPEVNHFEMASLSKDSENFAVVVLQNPDDNKRIYKRQEITLKLLQGHGVNGVLVKIKGKSYTEKLFNTVSLGMWTGLKLCEHYEEDPSTLEIVDELKKEIKTDREIERLMK